MNQNTEDEFSELAEQIIQKAETIDCPIADFYYGLKLVAQEISRRLECAESDGVNLNEK